MLGRWEFEVSHCSFSRSRSRTWRRSSSFSALDTASDSAVCSFIEVDRKEGEESESVPESDAGMVVFFLASIAVPKETKLPSSEECLLAELEVCEFIASERPSNWMVVAASPKSSSSISSNRISSLDLNLLESESKMTPSQCSMESYVNQSFVDGWSF